MSDASTSLEPSEALQARKAVIADKKDEEEAEEEEEEEESSGEEEEEEDDAEAIARSLADQLWADIQKARANGTTSQAQQQQLTAPPASPPKVVDVVKSAKEEAALATMRTVLAFAEADTLVHLKLSTTTVPGADGKNVLDVIRNSVSANAISLDLAGALSQVVISLAKSEDLFPPLPVARNPPAKRKASADLSTLRPAKRVAEDTRDLKIRLSEASAVITAALSTFPAPGTPPDASVISSVQPQLHQVFLFTSTYSTSVSEQTNKNALQEISGLIQVLGVLSGIQIAPPSLPDANSDAAPNTQQLNDIGTAVYPCLLPSCRKTFSRLFSLRQHQRFHSSYRPYKCTHCPASFTRNHDLRRHEKCHDRRAFKCLGCNKVFSRRDALKRHKSSVGGRAIGSTKRSVNAYGGVVTTLALSPTTNPCEKAETLEIELEEEDLNPSVEDAKEGRRAKLWNGITSADGGVISGDDVVPEEGELSSEELADVQTSVLRLHGLLFRYVAAALGASGGTGNGEAKEATISPTIVPVASADTLVVPPLTITQQDGQESLASIIARATGSSAGVSSTGEPSANGVNLPVSTQSTLEGSAEQDASGSLSNYSLNEDQAKLLEEAIARATAAAQAQAEAEALLEEGEEDEDGDEPEEEEMDMDSS